MSSFDHETMSYLDPGNDRRVVLITGGNSGVGWYTVLNLYLHGYVVYIAGRSKTRTLKSIKELEREATAVRLQYTLQQTSYERFLGELHFLEVDLACLASVTRAVETFQKLETHLNILVNNAGCMAQPHSLTKDGFEIQMQTNYISPFLLTTKLIPLLEETNELYPESVPPKIIYLSSIGHRLAVRYFNLNCTFDYKPNMLFTWIRYGLAKTCGIHFMKMLALRNPKILCLSVHPGFVMNTNSFAYWTSLPIIGIIFWCLFYIFGYLFGVTFEQGALTTVRLCMDPKLTLEKDNGKYFGNKGVEAEPSIIARNMNYAARTWIWTVHQLSERKIAIPN